MASVQAISQLPDCLIIAVLGAASRSLAVQLKLLPEHLHMMALHAAWPDIVARQSLVIPSCGGTFPQLTTLTCLNLFGDCNKTGIEHMSPHLHSLPSLSELNLGGCCMDHEGSQVLAQHLSKLTSLTKLDLQSNHLGT